VPNDLDALPLPPGNRSFPLLGETLAFLKDGFGFVAKRVEKHGPVFKTSLLGKTTVFLAGARVSGVFLDEACVQREGSMPGHVQELFGGQSLPLLDGDVHRARKEQVLAAFERTAMPGYLVEMQAAIEQALEAWVARGEIRAVEELKRLAITIIARNMTGLGAGEDLETLLTGFKNVTGGFAGIPVPLPGTAYKRGLDARDRIFEILGRLVAEHRRAPREDGLGRILARESTDGSRIADEDAVRELHHVFIAGYIVFAELAALLDRLADDPALLASLTAEVRAASPSGPIAPKAFASMPLLDQVVKETKRITPVVPVSFGKAKATFAIEGYRVPEGTMVFWSPWAHDQDRLTFTEPERFDPDRFGAARAEDRKDRLAFAPQGMGEPLGHLCPGVDYASLFMQAFTVVLLRGYAWSFPEQDTALAFSRIPPEHAEGLRVVFERATDATSPRAVRAAGKRSRLDDDLKLPVLDQDALLALASVIWADGIFTAEEASAFVRIAKASGISERGLERIERATRERHEVEAGPLALDGPTAEHVYSLACLIAACDGEVDPRERAAVAALGDRLGLDPAARERASVASHAVAQALGATDKALAALAAELEREASP
jgi:cytochrome P450/tellurite resistance protein